MIYANLNLIVSTFEVWGILLAIFFISIVLFIAREKIRLAYGIFEFLVGFISVFFVDPHGITCIKVRLDTNLSIKLLGALYIMVRGLDNIVKGLQGRKSGVWLKEKLGIPQ
ncbi:hypothetical protein GO755_14225 [Spirosoma sp. HMF4905]|uniref:Uncharacterized protein n=1 Tax=Spirosoma arboris TaxID=2682092 RepID=A0A7K1SBQ0_9BACT|nr:hypothetical protein [Spirosoma arboris]MVM31195.1 hypothetical protein [Spirosoma arboris]